MRLAFLVLDGGLGGHTRSAASVATGLRERGHEIQVFLGTASPEGVIRDAGLPFEKVQHEARTELDTALERYAPDAIHTFSTLGLAEAVAWGKAHDVPVVYTRCGGPPVHEPMEVRMMRHLGLRRFTCFSEENKTELLGKSDARPEDAYVLLARMDVAGVRAKQDPAKWTVFRERTGLSPEVPVVLRIARLGPAYEDTVLQGLEATERANALGADYAFVHIGYADVATSLENVRAAVERANERAGRIMAVTDQESSQDAQAHVGMADLVLGMARSAFEGMALGKPAVVMGKDGGGGLLTEEIFDELARFNFTGRTDGPPLGREATVERLAQTALRLQKDPEFAGAVSRFSIRYAEERLDVRLALDTYEHLYKDRDPRWWPEDARIRQALRWSRLKRTLRPLMAKGLRSKISSAINRQR